MLASTSEVYGDPLQHPQREDYWGNVNPIGPRSVYDEAKRYAEALTFAYRRERQMSVGVARIFNTYGPHMRADDGRAVPTFCRQALNGEPMTVSGNGDQTRSLCYVDDTITGLLSLAVSDFEGPVNIGNPEELTVLRIAELIRDLAGSDSPIEFTPAVTDDPRRRCPDITRAQDRLGWAPVISYTKGLAATVELVSCQFRRIFAHVDTGSMMRILGINAVFHDPAAALVVDGQVVAAAEEERFSRRKHGKQAVPFSTWELPTAAAKWCLGEAGLQPQDVDAVGYSYDPGLMEGESDDLEGLDSQWEYLRTLYARRAPGFLAAALPGLDPAAVHHVRHHVAHAASTALAVAAPRLRGLVVDGRGERTSMLAGVYRDHKLDVLASQSLPHSFGSPVRKPHRAPGFHASSDEYKVMAMGSYGIPRFADYLRERVSLQLATAGFAPMPSTGTGSLRRGNATPSHEISAFARPGARTRGSGLQRAAGRRGGAAGAGGGGCGTASRPTICAWPGELRSIVLRIPVFTPRAASPSVGTAGRRGFRNRARRGAGGGRRTR